MSSRIDEILQIIEMAPDDPFPRYGLAMEYKNAGRHDEALQVFAELQKRHPSYPAQYLMHGNLLAQLKRTAEAQAVYEAGLREVRNPHARGELQAALGSLGTGENDEDDDN